MREALRLAYLEALGVPNWVPRRPLARAALRQPAELDPVLEHRASGNVVPASKVPDGASLGDTAPAADSIQTRPAPNRPAVQQVDAVEAVRAAVTSPREGSSRPAAIPTPSPATTTTAAPALGPFYLQLWQAGSCVLLLDIDEPGLVTGSGPQRLLADILRAARLPTPHLLADFRWPLIRNQADRSAAAARDGLQAFVQARLEGLDAVSLGCFGEMAWLVAGADLGQAAQLLGREEALESLPPTWFAPDLESLIQQPEHKAQLWMLLKRVKGRWMQAG